MQVGFLYLRYVANPKTLWDEWLSGYMHDSEVSLPAWLAQRHRPVMCTGLVLAEGACNCKLLRLHAQLLGCKLLQKHVCW